MYSINVHTEGHSQQHSWSKQKIHNKLHPNMKMLWNKSSMMKPLVSISNSNNFELQSQNASLSGDEYYPQLYIKM